MRLGGGGVNILDSNTQSTKICLNFNGEGGILESNTQSAKICLNFNWGGVYSGVKYSKCQDLPKFQFGGGGYLWSQILKVPRSA